MMRTVRLRWISTLAAVVVWTTDVAAAACDLNKTTETVCGTRMRIMLLTSPHDADGNAVIVFDVDLRSEQGGRLAMSNQGNAVFYFPPAGFTGVDRFGYALIDSTGKEHQGRVTVTVNPDPKAPPVGAKVPDKVAVPPVFSSHMVLQRDRPIPVWGTAAPGETVTIDFCGQQKESVADAGGNWRLMLDPMQAGGPFALTIKGSTTIVLEDVLVGEVWVGSGQSNMDLDVGEAAGGDPLLAAAARNAYPRIRLLVSERNGWRLGKEGWHEATPETLRHFSALLFAFGHALQRELKVPVGLMEAAQGASSASSWISDETFANDPGLQAALKKYREGEYTQKMAAWRRAIASDEVVAAIKAGDSMRGGLPKPPRRGEQFYGLWTTGIQCVLYDARIRPILGYGMRGVLWDQGESGTGLIGIPGQYAFMGGLIRGWRKEWRIGDFPFIYVQKPSGAGCAWDDAHVVTRCARPFAPLPKEVPGTDAGSHNEDFIKIKSHPGTAMVISSDLGPNNHPVNKSGYGARAALVALGTVYGSTCEYYGPVYESHKVEGSAIRVCFTHVGQGLTWKQGERLQGFALAGLDKVFHWADAAIDGDTVVVSSDRVKQPVAVRYGWGETYNWANLFNKDRLPAIPFRSDDWK